MRTQVGARDKLEGCYWISCWTKVNEHVSSHWEWRWREVSRSHTEAGTWRVISTLQLEPYVKGRCNRFISSVLHNAEAFGKNNSQSQSLLKQADSCGETWQDLKKKVLCIGGAGAKDNRLERTCQGLFFWLSLQSVGFQMESRSLLLQDGKDSFFLSTLLG